MNNKIGIVGGGQLGRMLSIAAMQMGFHVTVTDPTPNSPAAQIADEHIKAGYSDAEATKKLAANTDYITIEVEHINAATLKELADRGHVINPSPNTIDMIKDKFAQKQYLGKYKIPTAEYKEVKNIDDAVSISKSWGFPLLLKSKHNAFDGRGNALVKNSKQLKESFEKLTGELYAEKFVPFKMELAVIAARDMKNNIVYYPVVETIHKDNICHIVKSPAQISPALRKNALILAAQVMKHLKGAGVFAIEMFVTKRGKILINEIAPRVHNSGHLTIEANHTSQFEQHIRAVTGLPLGDASMKVPAAVMINILGERDGEADLIGLDKVLKIPGVHVHIYGKKETRIQRKMGHITVIGKSVKDAYNKSLIARKLLSI